MSPIDTIIAGAGIIGLATALELADQGRRVLVCERGAPMREASWAAAGMLAVGDPENPPALRPLAEYSAALYPRFLARVEALSGVHVPLRTSETWQTVHGAGTPVRLDEHSLDPRDLCEALPRACEAAGVRLLTHTPMTDVRADRDMLSVHTAAGVFSATDFMDCRGAWAGPALGITPRKGQMLAVTLPPGVLLRSTLRSPEIYIVPRGEGRVIIGATVEDAGFDTQVDAAATEDLLRRAAALWPPIAGSRITDAWAGLRPATPDGLPILDRLSDQSSDRIFIAAGHFRNGILLAPGTARLMAAMVLGHRPEIDPAPYRARRFGVQDQATTAAMTTV